MERVTVHSSPSALTWLVPTSRGQAHQNLVLYCCHLWYGLMRSERSSFHRQNRGTRIGLRRSVCPYRRGRFLIPIVVLELALKFSIPSRGCWPSPHFLAASILGEIKFYRNKRSTLRMEACFIYSNYAQWKVSISTNLIDILLWTWLGKEKKEHKRRF